MTRRSALVAAVLAACAAPPKPVAEVWAAPSEAPAATTDLRAVLDGRAREALRAAQVDPARSEPQLAASRALFEAADTRLQTAVLAWLGEHPEADTNAVLDAEDHLGREVGEAVRSLCSEGLAAAERAVAAEPAPPGARLYLALHLSLVAWAEGPASALVSGRGPRVARAIEQALAAGESLEACAPLRLSGRFRTRAPWPYRDLERARVDLSRALAGAPTVVNALFLGDAEWLAGEHRAAREAWERAVGQPEGAPGTERERFELYRELARRRLGASAGADR